MRGAICDISLHISCSKSSAAKWGNKRSTGTCLQYVILASVPKSVVNDVIRRIHRHKSLAPSVSIAS